MPGHYDVVIVGGGHNGLTAAGYLARAGKSVLVLERLDRVGGAAVSAASFDGVDARLSRYSYLVSLLPARIIRELGLKVRLERRRYSSYTPRPGTDTGVLVDHADAAGTTAALGGDAAAWSEFYSDTERLARALFPTMTEPLLRRSEARAAVGDDRLWERLIERPVGSAILDSFTDDVVRGIVYTDALIGTFAPSIDETLDANRCLLYHVIGNGTGDWDVPVGGMGAVTGELFTAAKRAGARVVAGAEVTSITPDGEVAYQHGDREERANGAVVLANVAPWVLEGLVSGGGSTSVVEKPEGAQVKVNLLLRRLPKLRTRPSTLAQHSAEPSTSTRHGRSSTPRILRPLAARFLTRCRARYIATRSPIQASSHRNCVRAAPRLSRSSGCTLRTASFMRATPSRTTRHGGLSCRLRCSRH